MNKDVFKQFAEQMGLSVDFASIEVLLTSFKSFLDSKHTHFNEREKKELKSTYLILSVYCKRYNNDFWLSQEAKTNESDSTPTNKTYLSSKGQFLKDLFNPNKKAS